ncbi:lysylphosphatidylglycerol synthase transmembrane domain-containing protein [Parvibaculum sp. MBR-TMA-1.3b-4.2]|jgi:uncharacterized membrane protein YbhN (UPF0104 family)
MQRISPRWRQGAITVTVLALVGYLALSVMADGDRLMEAVAVIGWGRLSLVLLLSLANYALRFWRWQLYLGWLGHAVPAWRSLLVYLSGFALTVSPGKAGEAVRCLYLRRDGVPYSTGLAMMFVERLLDLLAILVLASFILLSRQDLSWTVGIFAICLAVGLAVLHHRHTPDLLTAMGRRLGGRAAGAADWLSTTLMHARALLGWSRLMPILLIAILSWGAEGVGVWVLASAFPASPDLVFSIGVYGLAILAGAAAVFLPAGLGGTEAVMTGLLLTAGLTLPEAVAITLICRLATLWFAVGVGAAALLWLEYRGGDGEGVHETHVSELHPGEASQ